MPESGGRFVTTSVTVIPGVDPPSPVLDHLAPSIREATLLQSTPDHLMNPGPWLLLPPTLPFPLLLCWRLPTNRHHHTLLWLAPPALLLQSHAQLALIKNLGSTSRLLSRVSPSWLLSTRSPSIFPISQMSLQSWPPCSGHSLGCYRNSSMASTGRLPPNNDPSSLCNSHSSQATDLQVHNGSHQDRPLELSWVNSKIAVIQQAVVQEKVHIICLQDTRLAPNKPNSAKSKLTIPVPGYDIYHNPKSESSHRMLTAISRNIPFAEVSNNFDFGPGCQHLSIYFCNTSLFRCKFT